MKNLLIFFSVLLLAASCSKEKAEITPIADTNTSTVRLKATTRSVPSQYATIQAAVNAAVSGDIISIANGTYNERVTIPSSKNNIRIVGASQTGVIL